MFHILAAKIAVASLALGLVAPDKPSIARAGKYQVELRLPEGGLFAGEETDVEFRVTDTTQKDPVEDGFKGVANVEATALVTMPAMEGMPPAKPAIHREGVPGEYGIALYFPHGGGYRVGLTLTPPNAKPFRVSFDVDVKDERKKTDRQVQPFVLKVVEFPAVAGKPGNLSLRVLDTKTGKTQTAFDEAHTMRFHLLIASKDLNWFVHEHPTMASDGTWSIRQTLPAGGVYGVYGDVAPSGMGSRILVAKISVKGPKPTWDTKLRLSKTASDQGLKGTLSTSDAAIPIGRMTTVRIKLTDAKSGVVVGDTKPWLGAAGHLMIFHQDGRTVVHSHPQESAASSGQVKKGLIQFNARFPKAGLYKVYGQFNWHGKIHTLGFTVKVK